MKAHQYASVLVLVLSGAWVITGDFSYVGSAASQSSGEATIEPTSVEDDETTITGRALQTVGVAVIPQVQHARTVRISGVTQADKTTQITARESGIIGKLPVKQGGRVSKGDMLARLDPEGRDIQLASAEAQLKRRRTELEARAELVARGTLPKLQLEELITAVADAEADLAGLKAELDRLDITAPFDGVLDVVNVELGSAVQPGVAVGTLIALDPIIGVGEINEQDLSLVAVGDSASLRLVSGETVDGTVRYISREANPATRTYEVEVEVQNPDLTIPSGMTAEIILRGKPVLATPAPRSIITLDSRGNLGVRSVDDENKVVFHPIDIVDDSSNALILGGIPEGARIIVAGQNIVSDEQTVDPQLVEQDIINTLIEEVRGEVVSQ
ncbi:MAG: efflux RND transporter periplasmic adaptor subunit [Pseudomonadota bacterium]